MRTERMLSKALFPHLLPSPVLPSHPDDTTSLLIILRLTSVRYPGCLNWEIDVQPECENAAVFPIMFLMFTENMVKHNMIMREQLTTKITGVMRTKNATAI